MAPPADGSLPEGPAAPGPPATGGPGGRRAPLSITLEKAHQIATIVIAAVLIIFLLMALFGYAFHVQPERDRDGKGGNGGRDGKPGMTQPANR